MGTVLRSKFWVPGKPFAKQRHRTRVIQTKDGRAFASQYTLKETAVYENLVKLSARDADVAVIAEGAVQLTITAYWPMRGQPLKRSKRPRERKVTIPDLDNCVKVISDALNGIAWRDDAQVAVLVASKWHAAQGEGSGVEVEIEAITEGEGQYWEKI